MKALKVLLFGIVFSQMHFFSAIAQTPDTLLLDQIEVTALSQNSKNDMLQHQFDPEILASNRSATFADFLQQNSQVFIKDYGPGSLATASFRGTTASHTKVLWNGMPVNAPNHGQVDFNRLPVFFVDEAQLAWGAHAANQQGGIGGVVALNNKSQFNKGIELTAKQAFGSFNSYGSYMDISWSGAQLNSRTRVFRASSDNDFEYLNTAPIQTQKMRQKDADFLDRGFMQELYWQVGKGIFSLISWNQWNERNLPPIMTNLERGGNPEEFQNDRFHRQILGYKHFWEKASLEIKTAYFDERQHYFLRTTSNFNDHATVSLINSKNDIRVYQFLTSYLQQIGKRWELTTAIDINKQMAFSTNYEEPQHRNQMSLLANAMYKDLKGNKLQLGAHQDDVDGQLMVFSPFMMYSARLPLTENWRYTAGVSRNFRVPGMNDLYWYPGGNPGLKEEVASQADFSLHYEKSLEKAFLNIRGGIYASDIREWIQWRPTAYRYWVPENVSRVFARGAELTLGGRLDDGLFNHQIQINFAYTRTTDESTVAQIENTQGRQLIYIPMHHGNLFYKMGFRAWELQYTLVYTGSRNTSLNKVDFYGFQLPAYTLHHIAITKKWHEFIAEIRINNLFDKDYQAIRWRAMPGRNFAIALSYQLKSKP
ncbi:MAG: TonB-dependent receptor [Bacteroidetes bacterium]|jgi:vitamin B12 transporter|nr:TonB-dependent receptor [Bacteroidota bacterium]